MKLLLRGCLLWMCALPATSFAREVSFTCSDEIYVCYRDDVGQTSCQWASGIGMQVHVSVEQDLRASAAGARQSIWTGSYSETVHDARVRLDVKLYDTAGAPPSYDNTLSVTRGSITAESNGAFYVRTGLRFKSDGIGYRCRISGY